MSETRKVGMPEEGGEKSLLAFYELMFNWKSLICKAISNYCHSLYTEIK